MGAPRTASFSAFLFFDPFPFAGLATTTFLSQQTSPAPVIQDPSPEDQRFSLLSAHNTSNVLSDSPSASSVDSTAK